MNKTLKSILTRLNNKGTVTALAALVIELLLQFGVKIDSTKVLTIINIICSISILLGVMNDPTSDNEMYIPGISDKLTNNSIDKDE